SVNMTPATVGLRSVWTTTPTLGLLNRPTRWRYVMAESEFADHQTSRTAPGTSVAEWTLSTVRCWPAKLAAVLSSSTADDRTANGGAKAATASASFSMALSSCEATASTKSPDSATPGGTNRPWRAASPSPTALDPKSDFSRAFAKGTTFFTLTRAP